MSGLKKNHAMAIVSKERVDPTTKAKIKAANYTKVVTRYPNNGISLVK